MGLPRRLLDRLGKRAAGGPDRGAIPAAGTAGQGRNGRGPGRSGHALGFLTPLMVDLAGALGVAAHQVAGTPATPPGDRLDELAVLVPSVLSPGDRDGLVVPAHPPRDLGDEPGQHVIA